ncbi:T9SS type A sorting domain-containing protein [Flavobacterium sp. 25HG05S-40]|uniref:T9SS type A sorting domain-containing protein n=1 Tax=Flavobacterium sp. 25HG05S-40 TaxID=3458682 RepID=UPI0040447CBF
MKKQILSIACIAASLFSNAQCVDMIGAGRGHCVVIKSDHTLWSWGGDAENQLGNGTAGSTRVPTRISSDADWETIAVGDNHCIALKANGTLWAFGKNQLGYLGNGSMTAILEPTQIGTDNNWIQVGTGRHVSIALKSDGTLWNWGWNDEGGIGDGTNINRLIPTQLGTDNDWVKVIQGYYHTVAIKSNGTLWYWGWNVTGIGTGGSYTTNQLLAPTQVGTGTDWLNPRDMSAGNLHTMIIKSNGTLWGWGINDFGQVGDGTGLAKTAPTQIGTENSWMKIKSGLGHNVAVKADGTLWTFGLNNSGQIGNNTLGTDAPSMSNLSPIQITTDNDWNSVAVGSHSSYAIKNNGNIWVWGFNYVSMLGLNPTPPQQNYLVPTPVDLCALLSVERIENDLISIKAYPNPTNGILHIEAEAAIYKIECYDVLGRQVFTNSYNSDKVQVNLLTLNKGSYLVRIFTDEGIQNFNIIKD